MFGSHTTSAPITSGTPLGGGAVTGNRLAQNSWKWDKLRIKKTRSGGADNPEGQMNWNQDDPEKR